MCPCVIRPVARSRISRRDVAALGRRRLRDLIGRQREVEVRDAHAPILVDARATSGRRSPRRYTLDAMDSVTRRSPMPVPDRDAVGVAHAAGGARAADAALGSPCASWRGTGGLENGTRVTLAVPFGPAAPALGVRAPRRRPAARLRRRADRRARSRAGSTSTRWTRRRTRRRRSSRTASSTPARRARSAAPSHAAPSPPGCRRCFATATRRWPRISPRTPASPIGPRLTVGITGASGLVGTALTALPDHAAGIASSGSSAARPATRPTSSPGIRSAASRRRIESPAARRRDPSRRRRRRRSALDAARAWR